MNEGEHLEAKLIKKNESVFLDTNKVAKINFFL